MNKEKNSGQSPLPADSTVVAKAGVWYTVANFLLRGLGFITTPLFARLFDKAELGYYSNFVTWLGVLLAITSLDFSQSIIRSKLEVKDDLDSYIWSILSLSSLWTLFLYGVFLCFQSFFVSLFDVDAIHIHIMFLYFFFVPAYEMFVTKQRAFYKYRLFALLTSLASLFATVGSVAMAFLMTDRVTGRIIGHYAPFVLLGAVMFVLIVVKGKTIKVRYWSYVVKLCVPLLPHNLSLHLLNVSDKIVITKLCGREYTAIYSIAYTCYSIISILQRSLRSSTMPWVIDSLHTGNYQGIRRVSKKVILFFIAVSLLVILFAPEFILVIGGKKYADAVYCMPPLIASCVIQFIYTFYVNVEFYTKKTIGTSIATMVATGANIGLNFLFIPMALERGYVIAAYTTLVGYIILFFLHYLYVRHLGYAKVFDTKFNILAILIVCILALAINLLYGHNIIRYIVAGLYYAALLSVCIVKRNEISGMFKKKKSQELSESA